MDKIHCQASLDALSSAKLLHYSRFLTMLNVQLFCTLLANVLLTQSLQRCACTSALSLTSSIESVGIYVTACPQTNVNFSCSATQVSSMMWFALPHLDEDDTIVLFASQNVYSSVINDVFNISLVSVDNKRGPIADITSRLSIRVDGINNGTNVSCITVSKTESRIILKQVPPAPSSFVTNVTDFLLLSASVIVSWKIPDHTHVDGYKIEFNTSKETVVFTNKTQVSLEIDYKRVLIYTISAFNCYGKSEDVADEIFIAGCAPPSPPVNGSVGEFISSRVGAQVTYSCDTDLVLVGEAVATCSLPSLQWMPSIDDVSCIQPPECGNPTEYLQANISISSLNSSVVTVSCATGYVLYGSKTSECVHGKVTVIAGKILFTFTL
ncbi:hypothetical protein GBAR_LOCUS12988 [Geodia barretti]|uniref:Sushi domain-containing protein n=1 Tax=Geodia barretti TaxID=519541 RepID=A0AA35S268_GEOBA|nr:hypothetical protein GBAR_LOCUS12988 [Geodia barretti]